MPIDRKRRQDDDEPVDRSCSDEEMVAMSLTEGESDLDDIEERSVHEDAALDGGYELPPPMTESEDEDDMMPILAASDAEDQESTAPSASMYSKYLMGLA